MNHTFIYLIMIIIILILLILMILVSVAFLTLMERKFLSYIQIRKGPNKVGFGGLLQPFSDAIKLMSKEIFLMNKLNSMIYLFSPLFSFVLVIMMWMIYPFMSNYLNLGSGYLYMICCLSFSVYSLLMSGWSSNCSYAMLGSIRSLAQSVSYEVSLFIIMLIPLFLIDSFNLNDLIYIQMKMSNLIFMWPLGAVFLFSLMAELNRTPFDFSESESELISGFNIEYMSSVFTIFFLSEYMSILLLSFIFNLFFVGGNLFGFLFYLKIIIMSFLIIWVRGSLPRFRYDLLMYLCWLMILPFTLNYMFYMVFFKIMIFK